MGNTLKRLTMVFFEDGLAMAGLLVVIASCSLFILFGMADVQLSKLMPFDDLTSGNQSILFKYFLDLSTILSSVLMTICLVAFVFSQMLLINFFCQSKQVIWLIMIGVAIGLFYLSLSFIVPKVKNFESEMFGEGFVTELVMNHDYNAAYGVVDGNEDLSELDRAYMNAQISAYKFIEDPTIGNQEILNADSLGLEIALIDSKDAKNTLDPNVIASIYDLATNQKELPVVGVIADEVENKEWLFFMFVSFLYVAIIYKISVYRREVGF